MIPQSQPANGAFVARFEIAFDESGEKAAALD